MEIEVERREGGGGIYRAGPVNIHDYLMKERSPFTINFKLILFVWTAVAWLADCQNAERGQHWTHYGARLSAVLSDERSSTDHWFRDS